MAPMPIIFFWLLYGPQSLLLTLVILYCIEKWKNQLNSAYYLVVRCDFIINLFVLLQTWMTRAATLKIAETLELIIGNANFIHLINENWSLFFFHLQAGSLLVKCAFHLSATTKSHSLDFWKNNYRRIYFVVCLLAVFCTVLPYSLSSQPETVAYNGSTNSSAHLPDSWANWIVDLEIAIYILATLILGVHASRQINSRWNHHQVMKIKLLIRSLLDMFLYLTVWLCHFLPRYLDMTTADRIGLLFLSQDLISCLTPFIFVCLDAQFRRVFRANVENIESDPLARLTAIRF